MRVVLFASGGDIPLCALQALRQVSDVVAVVRPGTEPGALPALRRVARRLVRGAPPPDPLSALTQQRGIPERRIRGAADPSLAPWLRTLGTELVCVATFPWRVRDDVLAVPPFGAMNVHPSRLPRHRGPNPWFWTYHADDREAGVTVHVCAPSIDAGAVLAQRSWPLPRGYPVASLHREVAERGAALLAETVEAAGRNAQQPVPQDETRATRAPRVPPGTAMVDYTWPVERVWHLLAGTAGQFREPLRSSGAPAVYDRVPRFEPCAPRVAAGTVEVVRPDAVWRLWCRDGFVQLEGGAG